MSGLAPREVARLVADGWLLGLRLLGRHSVLGFKRLVLPVSYWRTAEFAYVHRQLTQLNTGQSVLDVGSPKELAFSLSRRTGATVWATDILPSAVQQSDAYAAALSPGRIIAEAQDGRNLSYEAHTFDAAYSVSVLEHIPDDGDSAAMAELVRVVRPGGRIVATVPFAATYRETFVPRAVYDRARVGNELVFYQRHYDWNALHDRLLAVPGASVEHLAVWGEASFGFERLLSRWKLASVMLAPLEPVLGLAGLRDLATRPGQFSSAAFFTVRKML